MAEIIDIDPTTTHEIEDVVEVPQSKRVDIHGPWDDETLSLEDRTDLLSKEVDRLENDAIVRRYVINGGISTGLSIRKFIEDRVKWKFTDAFLVVNTYNEIDVAIKECKSKGTNGNFEISGIYIEPLIQMLQNAEGTGHNSAKSFYETLLIPISEAVNKFREDNVRLQNLRLILGSMENQIESSKTVDSEALVGSQD